MAVNLAAKPNARHYHRCTWLLRTQHNSRYDAFFPAALYFSKVLQGFRMYITAYALKMVTKIMNELIKLKHFRSPALVNTVHERNFVPSHELGYGLITNQHELFYNAVGHPLIRHDIYRFALQVQGDFSFIRSKSMLPCASFYYAEFQPKSPCCANLQRNPCISQSAQNHFPPGSWLHLHKPSVVWNV